MKKVLILGITVISLISLVFCAFGCSQTAPAPSATSAPAATTAKPVETITFFFEGAMIPGQQMTRFVERWEALVNEALAGKAKIKLDYHFGEPVPTAEMLTGLGKGTIDMLSSAGSYYTGQMALGDIWYSPFNFKTFEDMSAAAMGKTHDILDKAYMAKANDRVLCYPFVSRYGIMLSKKHAKITKYEDLKGMIIGSLGGGSAMGVELIGAKSPGTVYGELYDLMQKGIIEGRLLPAWTLEYMKLWEVTHQACYPGLITQASNTFWINADKFNKLSKDVQDALYKTGRTKEFLTYMSQEVAKDEARVLKLAQDKYAFEVLEFPAADAAKMRAAVEGPVWAKYIENCEKQGLGAEAKQINDERVSRWK